MPHVRGEFSFGFFLINFPVNFFQVDGYVDIKQNRFGQPVEFYSDWDF